jgi:hypothetical protein
MRSSHHEAAISRKGWKPAGRKPNADRRCPGIPAFCLPSALMSVVNTSDREIPFRPRERHAPTEGAPSRRSPHLERARYDSSGPCAEHCNAPMTNTRVGCPLSFERTDFLSGRVVTDHQVKSTFQLCEHARDVPHAPVLRDAPIPHSENVAGGEAQRPSSRRNPEIGPPCKPS